MKEALEIALDYVLRTTHWTEGRDRHDTLKAIKEALEKDEKWTPDDMAYRPNGLSQPEQEPVATLNISRFRGHLVNHDFDYFGELPNGTHALYTTPPKREWVGLTDDEFDACWNNLFGTGNYNRRNVYQAIEAKLKEKNT